MIQTQLDGVVAGVRRRKPRDPTPRFKADRADQLDALLGCPEAQVPEGHLAREVWNHVEKLNLSEIEKGFSALGRHGFHPRNVVAVLVYGALVGLHESTKLGSALQTDAALRFLAGGYAISSGTLRRRRQQLGPFLQLVLEQTVALAKDLGLLDPNNIAIDSVRIQAHASMNAVRSLKRSEGRLKELEQVDVAGLSPEGLVEHQKKVHKHQHAVEHCKKEGITNFLTTNPSASVTKMGNGANAPAHRVTVSATGVSSRIVLGVLIDSHSGDGGKIEPSMKEVQRVLRQVGFASDTVLRGSADAGYWTEPDLAFAARERSNSIEMLIKEPENVQAKRSPDGEPYFSRERFTITGNTAVCPAGTTMKGPYKAINGRVVWKGVGCSNCPLKSQCTRGGHRELTSNPELERARKAMREQFASEEAQRRYNQRIAIVEPVFSNIESTMKYRRATTRHAQSIRAEILLKIIAHNISRLIHRQRVIRVEVFIEQF